MNGIGPQLPLSRDFVNGNYSLIVSYKKEVKQNIKNLLLTSPGERVMNPDFGVGLRRFLFEQRELVIPQVRQRIDQQINKINREQYLKIHSNYFFVWLTF